MIISEADRLTALVDSMAGSNRPPQKTRLNVHEICEHVVHLLRGEAPHGVVRSSATTTRVFPTDCSTATS